MTEAHMPRISVIGCGHWGKNLVRNFHELGVLSSICDSFPKNSAAMSEAYKVASCEFEDILSDPLVDAVAIATPAESHATLTENALLAGKHVFVEKPLALSVSEAESLCELATEKQCILMVGHVFLFHPAFRQLETLTRQGVLGRLQYVYSNRLSLGKVRRVENVLWSFTPHDISMVLALIRSNPDTILSHGAKFLHKNIFDIATTHLTFSGGEQAQVFASWLHPFKEQKLIVIGDRAMAVFDDLQPPDRQLLLYPHQIEWRDGIPEIDKAEWIPQEIDSAEPLRLECKHFLESIRNGTSPRTDGKHGVNVLRVIQASERSLLNGHPVRMGDVSIEFPDMINRNGVWIHKSAFIDEPSEIGEGTRIWHFSHVLKKSRIGRNCSIGQNVMVGTDVSIGNQCKIQNNVSLYKGVTLEAGVFCGPSCVFTNVLNPRAEIERKDEFRETLVKRGATIGANVTIVCGTTLGEYSFIAAGAVVTQDVPAFALMKGVPARRSGWVSHAGEPLSEDLVCPREGRRYRQVDENTLEAIGT